jgi:putative DNA primase/helicase
MLADPMQNDGFLQRFQVLVYPDTYPEWTAPELQAPTNKYALERVMKVVTCLNNLEQNGTDSSLEPRLLKFSSEAQAEFNQWHDTLERRIRPGGDLATDSAYKSWYAKTKSLCVSLAAIFHLCDLADQDRAWNDDLEPISLDALLMALDWCDYLEQHAKKIYALELNPDQAAAHTVVKLIEDKKIRDGSTLRDVKQANRTISRIIERGVFALESLGWLRIEETRATGKLDGRPKEIIRLHPDLKGGE